MLLKSCLGIVSGLRPIMSPFHISNEYLHRAVGTLWTVKAACNYFFNNHLYRAAPKQVAVGTWQGAAEGHVGYTPLYGYPHVRLSRHSQHGGRATVVVRVQPPHHVV